MLRVQENKDWLELPTEREKATGRKNMYDVCAELIIARASAGALRAPTVLHVRRGGLVRLAYRATDISRGAHNLQLGFGELCFFFVSPSGSFVACWWMKACGSG